MKFNKKPRFLPFLVLILIGSLSLSACFGSFPFWLGNALPGGKDWPDKLDCVVNVGDTSLKISHRVNYGPRGPWPVDFAWLPELKKYGALIVMNSF